MSLEITSRSRSNSAPYRLESVEAKENKKGMDCQSKIDTTVKSLFAVIESYSENTFIGSQARQQNLKRTNHLGADVRNLNQFIKKISAWLSLSYQRDFIDSAAEKKVVQALEKLYPIDLALEKPQNFSPALTVLNLIGVKSMDNIQTASKPSTT